MIFLKVKNSYNKKLVTWLDLNLQVALYLNIRVLVNIFLILLFILLILKYIKIKKYGNYVYNYYKNQP